MININEVRLIGQLAEDPQFGSSGNGNEWMRCRVLTNHPYRDANGEWQERVEGHSVVTFDKYRVEHGRKKLRKGDTVYVEGENRSSRREKDGKTEFFYGVFVPLGGKLHQMVPAGALRGEGRKDERSPESGVPRDGAPVNGRNPMDDFDDEIPF
jgi:single-stranded DNA-binding protein